MQPQAQASKTSEAGGTSPSRDSGLPASGGKFRISGPQPERLKPELTSFARKVANVFGGTLTGKDGSSHSKYTVNGNVSEHYTGNATDVFQINGKPAQGKALIAAGRAALIAAGMPRAKALKAPGGLYNVGRHQIIFGVNGTQYGGNHLDDRRHLRRARRAVGGTGRLLLRVRDRRPVSDRAPQGGRMSTHYDLLTEGEQAHWDAYANLRAISDWAGFQPSQGTRKSNARTWLQQKRKEIWRLAQPESEGGDGQGWDHADRRERYETLKDQNLNNSTVRRQETTLPANGCLDSERAVIEEREVWWQIDSTTDQQKADKQACTDWLIGQRKQIWHLMQDDPGGNDANHRQTRYDNLSIATKYGSAYEEWNAGHDQYGKAPSPVRRQVAIDHLADRVGYTESPADSNSDNRSDGISTSQRHTADGGTWLDNQPWCGCWCYYAAESAGLLGIDSHMASVAQIEDYAKAGQKCYRGWTTDRSRVQPGDLAIIGGYGVHVETVRGFNGANTKTYGGNTSSGSSGSQSNGGGAYARERTPSEVRGYALMDYPEDR
jgi:hypothetical protein